MSESNSNLVRKVIILSNKVYVDVLAEFSKDGLLIPKEITWEDPAQEGAGPAGPLSP